MYVIDDSLYKFISYTSLMLLIFLLISWFSWWCIHELCEWKSHKFRRSWRGANALYFPLNVNDSHWLAIKIDCISTEVVVFDCNLRCLSENVMGKVMLLIQTIILLVLRKFKVFEHIKESRNATWQYRRRRDLPQNSTYVY